jgi:protein-L-isoaspartate(D-aspartate) O-methyltransferase
MTLLASLLGAAGLVMLCACMEHDRQTAPEPGADPSSLVRRSPERAAERERMVAEQIEARGIADPFVLAALRSVPRHWFVPERLADEAYDDGPLAIGSGQTISQPYIVALMTEAVAPRPGDRVLDVGTGSGYQAAVLAEITPHVWSIEIVPELADSAARRLADRGYDSVQVRQGDGWLGWPEHAPFDAIILAAAPGQVPPALVQQLAPGGRLCLPLGGRDEAQELLLIVKAPDGTLSERRLETVRFVPMTGAADRRR